MSPRQIALKVLHKVAVSGASLSDALPPLLAGLPDRDRAFVQALCFTTLRWHHQLEALSRTLLSKPLRAKDRDVGLLLEMGLCELLHLRTPDYAAVRETAGLARASGKPWVVGLINAVLRRVQREGPALLETVNRDPAARLSLPGWLLEALQSAWPQEWEALGEALNRQAPMTLRVNGSRTDRDTYAAQLQAAGLAARAHPAVASALELDTPVDVAQLPGFGEGLVSVQDAAAQLAAPLLECRAGMRVLDACAAPGGKTLHLLESTEGRLDLTAVDADTARLERVRENLARGGYGARLVAGDASHPEQWHSGPLYDRILLDAPCSATGVIRRHPDIKVLRRETDITALAQRQAQLLNALWPLLAPGGMLLYATCSLLPQENAEQIRAFLHTHPDAAESPICGGWGRPGPPGRQILAGEQDMDGFYYARLTKS
ncbi:16S rRNA (cytosine(967)-C(5))-methyltransferase [Thioalkalivibrio denitrificans]|uniref:16S rRNA (cytosine(967)-C(5))-methyltransferase n=1 Tax=Thioalkalivibrio denitrificans TaxID=108003 RepID=A0A1V3NU94_9GAMM|nr:16S rRNA (cytosine(967)-C(5))-methyltransferase RsmB [Thioalkalivibrio denitrificans]OOG28660.1 16S rRNA (cytosine(967)-C(5))-methyltransferase [Thioalkalivibrio denitrificans]